MRVDDYILDGRHMEYRYRHVAKKDYAGFYHYHRGIELLIVHRGEGHVVLNRKMYTLGPGCIMFVQPFQLHRVHFDVSPLTPYERTVITFEPAWYFPAFQMFPSLRRFFEHMWKDELAVQVFQTEPQSGASAGTGMAYLDALLAHYAPHLSRRGAAETEPVEPASLMLLALFDFLQPMVADTDTALRVPRPERHVEKIMQWIEEHYAEPFDLETLASSLHLSKHHVSHLFRLETGSSLTDYLIARRIRQACWLLKTESISIEQVGVSVGIPNFSYFCRLFKKSTDMTPKEYRHHAMLN